MAFLLPILSFNFVFDSPVPGYFGDEVKANGDIVLLLKSDGDPEIIVQALTKMHRLAGGQLFNVDIQIKTSAAPPRATYILDASDKLTDRLMESNKDVLDTVLEMYAKDGEWKDGRWQQYQNGYTLNHTGYVLLESPITRTSYPHAWAESLHSVIDQGAMSEQAWWSRKTKDGLFYWNNI